MKKWDSRHETNDFIFDIALLKQDLRNNMLYHFCLAITNCFLNPFLLCEPGKKVYVEVYYVVFYVFRNPKKTYFEHLNLYSLECIDVRMIFESYTVRLLEYI